MSYQNTDIYKAHKKLGFPPIKKDIQFDILLNDNFEPIKCLLPNHNEHGFPLGLLNEYITITKSELKNHLKQTNYISKKLNSYSETYDGFWLKKHHNEFEFFERERGHSFNHKILNSEEEVLDIFVKLIGWCCKN